METDAAEVVWPALRDWSDPAEAAERLRPAVEAGAGGVIVFGGSVGAVRDVARRLAALRPAGAPVLAADLERGAGQQFAGATVLPTPMAIAATGRPDLAERAGRLTGAQARAAGVGVVFAPVCDVNLEPENPIVNVRAFSDDPAVVAAFAAAWVRGCEAAGAASCPKHFPGHGRAAVDSHVGLARIEAGADDLEAADLPPFRAAFAAGARCAMVAHVECAAFGDGPATRRPEAVAALRALGFDGVAFTDAMMMAGAGDDAARASAEAIAAGCDVALYPPDFRAAAEAVGRVDPRRRAEAAARVWRLRESLRAPAPAVEDAGLADEIAAAAITRIERDEPPVRLGAEARVYIVADSDAADAAPFLDALRSRGVSLRVERLRPGGAVPARADGLPAVVGLHLFPRAWRGRAGLDAAGLVGVDALSRQGPTAVVSFGDPYVLGKIRAAARFAAYDETPAMARAAAAALTGAPAPGRLPVTIDRTP